MKKYLAFLLDTFFIGNKKQQNTNKNNKFRGF